jgi:Na+/phosphate symporter
MFNESKKNKKTLRLSESQLVELIQKMVNESSIPTATTKAQGESKKENDENLSNVDKKMKDYLSIPGNNNNEFPKQNQKGENVKVNPTSEEAEMIDDEKGRGLENLNYDHEPSSRFKERLKKALEGDSTMGNGQDAANVVKSDLSKKIEKEVKRKEEAKKEEPLYKKEPVPVKTMNESDNKKSPLLMEEIAKMKSLSSYNKKTQ